MFCRVFSPLGVYKNAQIKIIFFLKIRMKKIVSIIIITILGLFSGCTNTIDQSNNNTEILDSSNYELATFAGGCFWCVEQPFNEIPGVISAISGYTGGDENNANYEAVSAGKTQHREVVQIVYNPNIISYEQLLQIFITQIDPTDDGGQFADRGFQYTTAIYYHSPYQKHIANEVLTFTERNTNFEKPFVIPLEKYLNFFPAEEYHQDYYKKNSAHYNAYKKGSGRKEFIEKMWKNSNELWEKKKTEEDSIAEEKIQKLSDLEKKILFQDGTEKPFDNKYWDNKQDGIYVDKITGEVLFSSKEKFVSGTGWPSFTRPITKETLEEVVDLSLGVKRTEIRSRSSDTHLGHVFTDGPAKDGGLRYCMNSAAMDFIPKEKMEEMGYGEYIN